MMTNLVSDVEVAKPLGEFVRVTWKHEDPRPHEFLAAMCPEDEGGYSAFAINYPDVLSQGETLEEAKANIAEAFLAMLEARRQHGEEMRYTDIDSLGLPANCLRVRIKVDG